LELRSSNLCVHVVFLLVDSAPSEIFSLSLHDALPIFKIDRDFVSRIREDDKARHIVESLIQLCKGLGLEVVAEGVEDHATLEILTAMGCEIAQGYVLGRPAALEATEELGRHRCIQRSTA